MCKYYYIRCTEFVYIPTLHRRQSHVRHMDIIIMIIILLLLYYYTINVAHACDKLGSVSLENDIVVNLSSGKLVFLFRLFFTNCWSVHSIYIYIYNI